MTGRLNLFDAAVVAVTVAMAMAMATASPVAAQERTCADAEARQLAEARARHLRARLSNESQRLASWRTTWVALYTAGTAGQITLAEVVGGDRRPVFYVGAVKAALGAVTTPLLSARFSVPAEASNPCEDVVALERTLIEAARRQAKGVKWTQHLGGLGVNVAGIVYLGLVHDLWVESLVGAVLGTAAGSLKVLTQPRRAPDWAESGLPGDEPWISRLQLSISASHVGVSLTF